MARRIYRCPQCRTRRTNWLLILQHMRKHDHNYCRCGGYWWPAHRPGSRCCEQHPEYLKNCAERAGYREVEYASGEPGPDVPF